MKTMLTASTAALMLGASLLAASCSQEENIQGETYDASSSAPEAETTTSDQTGGAQMVGAGVYDTNGVQVGVIEEVTTAENGVEQAVISVGGYLGLGSQQITVATNALTPTGDASGYSLPMTAEEIEAKLSQAQRPPEEDSQ